MLNFHLPVLPGSALKVFGGGGGGWWVGGSKVSLAFRFGPDLGLDLDLDQAEQYHCIGLDKYP